MIMARFGGQGDSHKVAKKWRNSVNSWCYIAAGYPQRYPQRILLGLKNLQLPLKLRVLLLVHGTIPKVVLKRYRRSNCTLVPPPKLGY